MIPTQLSFGDLLHLRQPFVVPKYQRAYAWEAVDVEDFVSDIRECYDLATTPHKRTHFFGGLVSIAHMDGAAIGRHYDVVDGQQRLATFTLALANLAFEYGAIAARAAQSTPPDEQTATVAQARRTKLEGEFLFYDDVVDGKPAKLMRLILSGADRLYFEALAKNPAQAPAANARESHNRLFTASKTLRNKLICGVLPKNTSAAAELAALELLKRILLEDCLLVHLVTDSQEEAFRLFQVLNDRGVGLTEGDLLRSGTLELLEQFPPLQASAERHWDSILSEGADETELFLRAYYNSCKGRRASKRELLQDFSTGFKLKRLDGEGALTQARADEVHLVLEAMSREAALYRRLDAKEWPYDSSSLLEWDRRRLAILLGTLKHKLCIPLLMAASTQLPEQAFAEVVRTLELFVFRYVSVCRAHAGKAADVYSRHCRLIRDNPAAFSVRGLRSDLAQLIAERARDDIFEVNLANLEYRERGSNETLRYFLVALEECWDWYDNGPQGDARCLQPHVLYVPSEVQVEHIYAQSAQQPDPSMEPIKHSLGNLSFWGLRENPAAGNTPFAGKRAKYAASSAAMTRSLAAVPTWDASAAATRKADLISRAKAVFRIT